MISILIPVIRPERAKKCIELATKNSGIASELIEIVVEDDTHRIGCPRMLKRLVEQAKYDHVVFLGDDTEPEENYLVNAYNRLQKEFPDGIGLVGFNDGIWNGNEKMSTHWIASKRLLPLIGGEFFHTGYIHCRCDIELADRTRAIGKYAWEETAKIKHAHPITAGNESLMDEDYARVYRPWVINHDMELYAHRKENGWKTNGYHQKFLQDLYTKMCKIKSDINEHLPTLKEYATGCDRIIEFGYRNGISTIALLAGCPKELITYDINPSCLQVYRHMKQIIHDSEFHLMPRNTIEIHPIGKTDFLFIDTLHDYNQCKRELALHGDNVTKFIGFHDTETFGSVDESGGGKGIRPAIEEFMAEKNWKIVHEAKNNNGLIIIGRQ